MTSTSPHRCQPARTTVRSAASSPRRSGRRSGSAREPGATTVTHATSAATRRRLVTEDVGRRPPSPHLTTAPDDQHEELRLSDELIGELDRANIIVIGTPMYNYGMPSALKSWFDKVIRIGKTFSFDLARGDFPLRADHERQDAGRCSSARGEFGFGPGGVRETMNHLETHIFTCAHYLGRAGEPPDRRRLSGVQ